VSIFYADFAKKIKKNKINEFKHSQKLRVLHAESSTKRRCRYRKPDRSLKSVRVSTSAWII